MELSQTSWLLAVIAALAVGMAKGGLSMVGMIAVPVMSLTMSPVLAAGILLPVYIVSDIGGLIAFRRSFNRQVLISLMPGAIAGIGLGWATAHLVDDAVVMLIIGLIGIAFSLNALFRPQVGGGRGPRWGAGSFWGALAGYTSFVSHSGGPPYQIYVQPMGLRSEVYAGTTTVTFAIMNAVKLIPYAALGQLNPGNLRIAALLCLPALAGVCLGLKLLRIIPQKLFYQLITWMLLIISVRLIWAGLADF
ncbi:sulfite exporter TauE/SafE family protein [Paracoccus sp. SCSIO 75233]|uniref:sulfite exporter TauE/SafE family protein n=1 Tax=Paracoccus sp. SCSIO 75233 TaxID=3017782 RepID=UPI0022F07D59|nr:sulfite exporter TauE/SafE family protein [Paracoccus sp. SCSIO 75233]WBU52287.1 sulfite exporter TauE/SafE family protein [Paracoccus sp. SCSIO 75233]